MSSAAKLLAVAAAEIGFKEGSRDKTKYGAWYGLDNNPWCMMFVSWCAEQAACGSGVIPKMAYVPYAVQWFESRGLYHAKAGFLPKQGDIIFYGSNSHVGIVESCDGTNVTTIEGNTSATGNSSSGDGVYRRVRALNNSWIKGYARPQYKEEDMQATEIIIRSLDKKQDVAVSGFLLADTTYIRLRDIEKLLPAKVDWDAAGRIATVESINVGGEA